MLLDDDQILDEAIEFDSIEEDQIISHAEIAIENEPLLQQSRLSNDTADEIEDSVKPAEASEKSSDEPPKPQNVCQICNKTFAKPKNLVRHKVVHEKNKNKETDFECTVCGLYYRHFTKSTITRFQLLNSWFEYRETNEAYQ